MPGKSGRGVAVLILLLFGAIAAALFNPLSLPVESELAVPVGLAVGVGGLLSVRGYRN
jgi:hypothetical protein